MISVLLRVELDLSVAAHRVALVALARAFEPAADADPVADPRVAGLRASMAETRAELGSESFVCEVCGRVFGSPQARGVHRARKHRVSKVKAPVVWEQPEVAPKVRPEFPGPADVAGPRAPFDAQAARDAAADAL